MLARTPWGNWQVLRPVQVRCLEAPRRMARGYAFAQNRLCAPLPLDGPADVYTDQHVAENARPPAPAGDAFLPPGPRCPGPAAPGRRSGKYNCHGG